MLYILQFEVFINVVWNFISRCRKTHIYIYIYIYIYGKTCLSWRSLKSGQLTDLNVKCCHYCAYRDYIRHRFTCYISQRVKGFGSPYVVSNPVIKGKLK
jgi:hypothetical protein